MRDAVIRIQETDGTWQTLSADRAAGITAEGLTLTANNYGLDTATFELHRDPGMAWPDLAAFTPVEVEVNNELCWTGRISETQVQDGSEKRLSVKAEGWQYHLDDDQINRTWVNRNLGDWQDIKNYGPLGTDWIGHSGNVEINDGNIWMGWKQGTLPKADQLLGIVLDLGGADSTSGTTIALKGTQYYEAGRISATNTTANASNFLNNFWGFASSSIANWVSGTAYASGAKVCDTQAGGYSRFYAANKAIPTANRTLPPSQNSTDWNEYFFPLALYAVGAKDDQALANIASMSAATVDATYSMNWGANGLNAGNIVAGSGIMANTSTGPARATDFVNLLSGSAKSLRYLVLILRFYQATASSAVANPYGLSITNVSTFGDISYSTSASSTLTNQTVGGVTAALTSTLKASQAITDAITVGAPKLGTTQVTSTSTSLQHLKADGYKTPREIIDQANAYHNWVARIDENKQMIFKPKPTVPLFEVGAWSGYEFSDQAASSGEDIYSRVVVDAQGAAGSPIRVARSAAQMASSTAISSSGASTLTTAQQSTIKVTSVPATDVTLLTQNGRVANIDSTLLADLDNDSTAPTLGNGFALFVYASGVFRAGITYELRGSIEHQATGSLANSVLLRVGANGITTGTAISVTTGAAVTVTSNGHSVSIPIAASDTNPVLFRLFWTPDTDQSFVTSGAFAANGIASLPFIVGRLATGIVDGGGTILCGVYSAYAGINTTAQQNLSLWTRAATLAERRGIRKTYQLSAPGVQTTATLAAIGDAWLYDKLRAQLRGTVTLSGLVSIRQHSTGDNVHPSRLLLAAGELIRMTDRIDPDTGALGRDARIQSVTYDHDSEQVSVELDNRRDNLQAFLNRLGTV